MDLVRTTVTPWWQTANSSLKAHRGCSSRIFIQNPKLQETVTFSQQFSFTSVGYMPKQTQVPQFLHLTHPCRNDAHCTHTSSHLLMNMHQALCSCSRKFGPPFCKLHSWAKDYITIRIRQIPSQQALQKSYQSQRMQPGQFSHCATCAFSFKNLMVRLIFSYLSGSPMVSVLKSLLLQLEPGGLGKVQN